MAEVDFPRGKPVSTEAEKKPKSVKGTVPYSKKSRKQTSKTKKGGSTNKSHQVVPAKVQFELTAESFHKDVLVLGCVNEVHNDEIIVELPNNSKGVVSHGGAGLGLVAGQVIAVGVTGAATTAGAGAGAGATGGAAGGARLMALTMQPDILNQNLSRPDIRQGMYISGVVSSVEDRGYTVTTEIKDTTSFIAAKDTKARLVVGQPVFCVVSSISPDSGHLFLIPQRTEDATFTEIRNWKSVAMVHVRPGNAVKAEVVRKFPTGLSVRIYNQPATSPLSVFIPVAHLHKPIEYYNIGFRVNGRVIFVDYSSQRVMVSTLPHLLNYSETTTLFDQYENLRGLVFPVTLPASSRPTCSLPTVPPASAVVVSNSTLPEQVTDVDSIDTESKQTQTDVKVTGVSYYMGMLQVSSDPEVVESATSTLRVQDLHPGMLVDGSVSEVSKAGIEVKISPLISGKCSAIHLSDAPSVLRVDSLFSAEQSTQCRILYIDEDENVHLTNKPTLVNSALRVISSYHHAIPGCVAHGWVSKVTKSEVTVSFYDNVTGLVPSSDIEGSPTESYPVGTAVACQVVECEEVQGSYKLQLTFDIQLARPVPSPPVLTKVRQAFSAAVIGDKVSGVVSHTDINALTLTLDSGVTAILPTQHLSDQHTICSTLITRYYIGTHMTDLVVLNKDSSNMRLVLSNKPSLRLSPVKYEDIKVGDVIPGHVKQISDSNYTIGFLGTWKAQVARKPESRVGYVLGQSVRALVTAILGNGGLAVDLEDVSTKTNGVSLLQEYFKGVDGLWSRTKIAKLYPIASVVSGKVVEHRGGQVVVLLANNVIALAQEHVTEYPIGQSVKGVVIDIDYTNAMVRLCLKKDIVDHIVSSSAIPTGKDLLGKVLHLTGSYVVVCVTITPDSRTIVYAPLGDYNTQGLGKEHFTHLLPGNSVHVTKPDSEGSKLHPIVALKSSRSTTPVDTDVKIEDASDEEQDDLSALVKPPTFIDEEDGEFQYVESDDSDNDPDRDDLQEYLNRVAKAKVIEAKSKNGTTNSKNSVPKDKNTQVQQKVQSKVQYSKEKRKSEVKQNSNKKMKIKK